MDDTTAKLPAGWKGRLVRVQNANTDLKTGWCLGPHDLAASKLYAAREKDMEFVKVMLDYGLIDRDVLDARIVTLPVAEPELTRTAQRLERLA